MALKVPLVIAGDASSAKAALEETSAAVDRAAKKAADWNAVLRRAEQSINVLASAQTRAKLETAQTTAAYKAGEITFAEYNRQLLETKTYLSLVEKEHRTTVNALNQARTALGGASVSAGQAQAGYVNLGRQMQDVAVQLQGGANIGTIIAQQGGQVADAVAQMGGRFAGFARFLSGPYGAAIIVGVGVLANLAGELWRNSEAAGAASSALDSVKLSTSSVSDIQSALGRVFDLTTGKMKDQTSAAIGLAKATIILAQAQSRARLNDANKAIADANEKQLVFSGGLGGGLYIGRERPIEGQVASQFRNGVINSSQAADKLRLFQQRGLISDEVASKLSAAIANAEVEAANLKAFDKAYTDLVDGKLSSQFERPTKAKKPKKVADRTAELANFGDDTASKIANIRTQFSDLPSEVKKSELAMRQLDDILADIGRKKGLKPEVAIALRNEIKDTRGVIENSLNKPFTDYIEKAQEAARIDALIAKGKDDQADALKVVLALEEKRPALSRAQLEAVLSTVQAERERALVMRDQRAIIQSQVRAVQDVRGALESTVADALRGKFSVEKVLSSIGNSYLNITAQKIVEATFGKTLRELEKQASALDPVNQAGRKMAEDFKVGGDAVRSFAEVVNEMRDLLDPRGAAGRSLSNALEPALDTFGSTIETAGGALASAIAGIANRFAQGPSADGLPLEVAGDQITVTANRKRSPSDISGTGGFFANMLMALSRDVGAGLPPVIGQVIGRSLTKLEKSLPQALAGAFTGASASRILLGDRGTTGTIGGAIGGALGQKFGEKFLSSGLEKIGGKVLGSLGGPIGSVVGGLLGGLIGGIFATKPRGSGTVTQSSISVSANRDSVKSSLNTLGGQLQQSVQSIADRLGGTVGNYEVGFGQYKDYYQVSKTGKDPFLGQTYYQNKSPNALYDGKDAAAALSAAISDAVADGAIQGISSRVAAALKSSSDIDKAVREATKVQDLELALGGVGEELRRQFAQFEQQAKERLRIAKQYGFDVVAVDKRNAEDRLKLQEKLAKQQAGPLQQLIDDLTAGSLFEGSAVDQRAALKDKIDKARADANAGVEGAADTLNQLLQQFNSVSKNVYGTTGGFADDRQQILDIARDAIQKANQRVAEAQKVTDPALTETNATLDEIAAQNARALAEMRLQTDYLKQFAAQKSGGNLSSLIAAARLS